jgi:hypothetical protein
MANNVWSRSAILNKNLLDETRATDISSEKVTSGSDTLSNGEGESNQHDDTFNSSISSIVECSGIDDNISSLKNKKYIFSKNSIFA